MLHKKTTKPALIPRQKWIRGVPDPDGYFYLANEGTGRYLTARKDDVLVTQGTYR